MKTLDEEIVLVGEKNNPVNYIISHDRSLLLTFQYLFSRFWHREVRHIYMRTSMVAHGIVELGIFTLR